MKAFLLVGIGGAAGSMARYAVSLAVKQSALSFPRGTFVINMLGCFIIGALIGYVNKQQVTNNDLLLILGTGFCGGFTTFSTFAYENMNLFSKHFPTIAIGYTVASVVLGVVLCRVGFALADKL